MKIINYPPPPPFPFLELPAEIRNDLYERYFNRSRFNEVFPARNYSCGSHQEQVVRAKTRESITYWTLLLTNSQIYREAHAIAYGPSIFPFLKLPPKLRKDIYGYAFSHSIYDWPSRSSPLLFGPSRRQNFQNYWALRLTNRQLSQETKTIASKCYLQQLREKCQVYEMNYCQWTLYDESYGWRTSREWKLKPKCSWCPRVSGLGALFNLRLASISIAISPPNTGSYKVALERLRPMVHAFLRLPTNNNLMSLEVYLPSLNEKYWPLLFEISEPITRLRTRCRLLILAPSPELQNAFVAFLEKRKQPQTGMMTIVYCRDAGADAERHYSYYQLN